MNGAHWNTTLPYSGTRLGVSVQRRPRSLGRGTLADILIESNPDMVFRVSSGFRYLDFHAGGGGLQPVVPPEQLIGATIDEVLPKKTAELGKTAVTAALASSRIARISYAVEIQGETHYREGRVIPFGHGEVIAIVRDFTAELSIPFGAVGGGMVSELVPASGDSIPVENPYELTLREATVLQLLAYGVTDKGIAAQLGVSVFTVNKHVGSILSKMHAATRTEAAVRAARDHLI